MTVLLECLLSPNLHVVLDLPSYIGPCLFVGVVSVAVSCVIGITRETESSTVRSTTGPVTESTATAARIPSLQDS